MDDYPLEALRGPQYFDPILPFGVDDDLPTNFFPAIDFGADPIIPEAVCAVGFKVVCMAHIFAVRVKLLRVAAVAVWAVGIDDPGATKRRFQLSGCKNMGLWPWAVRAGRERCGKEDERNHLVSPYI
ncbi:MAG TPA: hypothetical protein VF079_08870 [Sphingomicrobium sp.]